MRTNITAHFAAEEFACHGTPYPLDLPDAEVGGGLTWGDTRLRPLCEALEVIREASGGLVTVDSGYRTLAYDEKLYTAHVAAAGDDGKVAPASRSQHPKGRAADVKSDRLPPSELYALIMQLIVQGKLPRVGGVGLYPNFVHVDVRPMPASHVALWGGTRPSNLA